MLKIFKTIKLTKIDFLLFGMSVFCFLLTLIRYQLTGTKYFLFLNWNLFLAAIPYFASRLIGTDSSVKISKISLVFLLISWFVFLPNSPYILTDLLHLQENLSAPMWFNLILILTFAWTGLLYGILSLLNIENFLLKNIKPKLTYFLISFSLFIVSFGVYLGRYQRFNSWNILNNPFELFFEIIDTAVNPASHLKSWGMTLMLGTLLNMIYWSFKLINAKSITSQQLAAK